MDHLKSLANILAFLAMLGCVCVCVRGVSTFLVPASNKTTNLSHKAKFYLNKHAIYSQKSSAT